MVDKVNALLEMRIEGLVVLGGMDNDLLAAVTKAGVSAVSLAWHGILPAVHSIQVDYEDGARDLSAYLQQLGHRHVGIIDWHMGAEDREYGRCTGTTYPPILQSLGMTYEMVITPDTHPIDGEQAMDRILLGTDVPTAIIAASDMLAMGVLQACHRRGFRVPEDISVVGMDDILMAVGVFPKLTTLPLRKKDIASEMVRLAMQGPYETGQRVSIGHDKLIVRESTGVARNRT